MAELRESTPVFWSERSSQWVLTRFHDVYETLRDRRVGRAYTHRYDHAAFGRSEPDPRWADFHAHEEWSLLSLEPPDHTRIRRLVSKVFTPRAVTSLRPQLARVCDELLDSCDERGEFDLLADYAQPFSVAVICSLLGVPRDDTQQLLDWSHAIVKMYELNTSDEQRAAANTAAARVHRLHAVTDTPAAAEPDGLLVSELACVEDDGERLTDHEITCTTMVLLEAGHEATVNTLGNGMRALMLHPGEWARLTSGEVDAKTAVEEMLRWDSPLQLFERWVLEDGVEIAGQAMEVGRGGGHALRVGRTRHAALAGRRTASTSVAATRRTWASVAGSTSVSVHRSPVRRWRCPLADSLAASRISDWWRNRTTTPRSSSAASPRCGWQAERPMDSSLDLDIISNDAYAGGPPHELLTRLRHEAPVSRQRGREPQHPETYWAITKHADVVHASRQFQQFSSARRGCLLDDQREDLDLARMMIDTDPPEHTRLRTLVNRGFTPKAIKLLEDHFRDVAARLVHDAVAAGAVDFVDTVSVELPLIAIADLLGVPQEDRRRIFDWSNRMIGATDPAYSAGLDDAGAAAAELYFYAHELGEARRADPRDDIVSKLIEAEGGDQLTPHEFDVFVLLLAVAGNETTRNGISHGVLALIEHPDQFALLREEPALVERGVEEMLRWASPVNHFRRTATGDIELRGQQIRDGEAVVMFYFSANRDEEVFVDPFRFDVHRDPNPHLAFGGGGPHFCLGFQLARLEMRILFEQLVAQVGAMELTGPVRKLRSNFVHGIKELPVRLRP